MASSKRQYARWEHVIVAVDAVVFSIIDNVLHVLLIKTNKKEFKGHWALPGALVTPKESLDDALQRVLKEKTGLTNVFAEQLATFGDVDRDPFGRVVSVAYMALVHANRYVLTTTNEYEDIKWHPVDKLPRLAYDHRKIITEALKRLRAKLEYTNIVYNILPKEFTLTELQTVYEIILGKKLDKRNFRKKLLSLHIIKKTNKMRSGRRARPAVLYSFVKRKSQIVEIL